MQFWTVWRTRNLRTCVRGLHVSIIWVTSILVNKSENSVAAHWFLPFQKYVTSKRYLPVNTSIEICKSTVYYLSSLLKHDFDVLIAPHNQRMEMSTSAKLLTSSSLALVLHTCAMFAPQAVFLHLIVLNQSALCPAQKRNSRNICWINKRSKKRREGRVRSRKRKVGLIIMRIMEFSKSMGGTHSISISLWSFHRNLLGHVDFLWMWKTRHLAELSELTLKGIAHLFLSRGFHWLVFPLCWHLFSSSYGGISCPSWPLPWSLLSWERERCFPPGGSLPSHGRSIGVLGSSGQRQLAGKGHLWSWRCPGTLQI